MASGVTIVRHLRNFCEDDISRYLHYTYLLSTLHMITIISTHAYFHRYIDR